MGLDHRSGLRRRPARAGGGAVPARRALRRRLTCRPGATTATRRSTRASSTRRRTIVGPPGHPGGGGAQPAGGVEGPGGTWSGPTATAIPWGRTIGAISYMDSMEIVASSPAHPRVPAGAAPALASVYHAAWTWLQRDYRRDRHLLDMFGFGRGNYSYMTPARQWQQTTSFLGKAAHSLGLLAAALRAEKVARFPPQPPCPRSRASSGSGTAARSAGRGLAGAAGTAALRPAHHHRPQVGHRRLPACAARRCPGSPRRSSSWRPRWCPTSSSPTGACWWPATAPTRSTRTRRAAAARALAALGGGGREPARPVDAGLVSEVRFTIEGDTLVRSERLSAKRRLEVKRFAVVFPTTGARASTRASSPRTDRFESPDGLIENHAERDLPARGQPARHRRHARRPRPPRRNPALARARGPQSGGRARAAPHLHHPAARAGRLNQFLGKAM